MKLTREEAIKQLSELCCAYQHVRMTDCPHCAKEVEQLVQIMTTYESRAVTS